jgi:uncharacterized repeat protein (TIGR01451 family)
VRSSTSRRSLAGLLAWALIAQTLTLTAFVAAPAAPARADDGAAITVDKASPARILAGENARYEITVRNSGAAVVVYNATITDLLPAGSTYLGNVSPASAGDPVIRTDPVSGRTLLIWANITDLPQGGSYTLAFDVDPGPAGDVVGNVLVNEANAATSTDERDVPDLDASGRPVPAPTTQTASDTLNTQVAAIEVRKTNTNSPEGELLRGVHDQRSVYELQVENNKAAATTGVTLVDYLPAGLEFLGCGDVDYTREGVVEYPGARRLGLPPLVPDRCVLPVAVETVVDPADPAVNLPAGTFTKVTWTIGTLAPGDIATVRYVAGIPLRANSALFVGGEAPDPASLRQTANLDNNIGISTQELPVERTLRNFAAATGTYTGALAPGADPQAQADTSNTVTIEDLRLRKSLSPTSPAINDIVRYSLTIDTSEYVSADGIVLTDDLPDGMCPIGAGNLAGDDACAGLPGEPSSPYDRITANTTTGGYTIVFDPVAVPARNGTLTVTFPALFKPEFNDHGPRAGRPTVGADEFTNVVGLLGATEPAVDSGEQPQGGVTDSSEASFGTPRSVLTKQMKPRAIGMNCDPGVAPAYADAETIPDAQRAFRQDDLVCFKVRIDFPTTIATRNMLLTDFLPTDTVYEPGTYAPTSNNTVAVRDLTTDPRIIRVVLGTETPAGSGSFFAQPGDVFEAVFAVRVLQAAPGPGPDITANLVKTRYQNTDGLLFADRDQAFFGILPPPDVAILKGVYRVDAPASGPNPANVDGSVVQQDATATFRLDIANRPLTGLEGLDYSIRGTSVWDVLAPGIGCGAVSNFRVAAKGPTPNPNPTLVALPGGIATCYEPGSGPAVDPSFGNRANQALIVWNFPSPDAADTFAVNPGQTMTVAYDVRLPALISVSSRFDNDAAVARYESFTNTRNETTAFVPRDNVNPDFAADENAAPVRDDSFVVTAAAAVAKTQTTAIEEAGNNRARDAVIGEEITYDVSVTVPAQTTVFNAVLRDPLPRSGANQHIELLSATQSGPPGPTLDANTGTDTATLTFPPTYTNTTGAPQVFGMRITARMTTNSQNTNGTSRTNTVTFSSNATLGGTPLPARTATSQARVVEPSPTVTKSASPTTVIGGQTVIYTVTASNANNRPPLHDAFTSDCLPALLTYDGEVANGGGAVTTSPGTGAAGNCPVGTTRIEWQVGTVLPGSANAKVLRYRAVVSEQVVAGTQLRNDVRLTGTSLNNGTTATQPIERAYNSTSFAVLDISGADLSKGVAPGQATIGQSVEYTVAGVLPANVNAYEASLLDQLPAGIDPQVEVLSVTCSGSTAGCAQVEGNPGFGSQLTRNGQTIGFLIGDALTDPSERLITIRYRTTVLNQPRDAVGDPNRAGARPTNSVRVWWSTQAAAAPPASVDDPPGLPGAVSRGPVTAQFLVVEPQLRIDKSLLNPVVRPGDQLLYRVNVSNPTGATVSEAFDVSVSDTVPLGIVVDPATITGGGVLSGADPVRGGGTISWGPAGIGPLKPGETVQVVYNARLAPSETLTSAPLRNTAEIEEYFSLPAGNAERRRYTGPSDTVEVVPQFPRIVTEKSVAAGDEAQLDAAFGWRVVVRNTGGADAVGVDVTDTLPRNWCFIDGSARITLPGQPEQAIDPSDAPEECTGSFQQVLTWTDLGTLAPGQQLVITYDSAPTQQVVLDPGVGLGVPHVNTAQSIGQDATGATGNADGSYSAGPDTAQARIRNSDLQLTKEAVAPVVTAGTNGSFTISVRNLGPDTALGPFRIADTLPPRLPFVSAGGGGWQCASTGTALSCNLPGVAELAAGAALPDLTVVLAVPADTPDAEVFENIATVQGGSLDTNQANNTDNAFITAQRVADLQIVKTTATAPVVAGQAITYALDVRNLGTSTAEGPIVVRDELPVPLVPVSAAGDGWECRITDQVVLCQSPPDLPAGAALPTITVVADVPADFTGPLVNTATVGSVSVDPDLSNNTSTVTDQVTASADLFLQKATVTDPLVAGREVTYTLDVGNLGPSVSRQPITVTDTLPAGLTFVSATGSGWTCTAAITCTYRVDLPPNVNAPQITVVALVGSDVSGPVTNPASVTGPTPDPDVTNNVDEVTDPVTGQADLAVVKTTVSEVVPGRDVTYEIAVTNNGPSTSRQPITVTDTLPTGLTFVSAGGTGWTCDAAIACVRTTDLAAGEAAPPITVVATLDADFAGPLVNTAAVTGTTPDPEPDNNTSTVTDEPTPLADLSIVKTTTSPVVPGDEVTYTLLVANAGPSTSRGPIRVDDVLPAGLAFVSAAGEGWACEEGLSCTRQEDLPSGASAPLITVVAALDPAFTGDLVNTATVTGTTPDPEPGNNSSTVTDPAVPSADLAITKRTASEVVPGEEVTYELVVTNNGPSVSRAPITVADPLPPELTLVSVTGDGWTCDAAISCVRSDDLAAGSTAPTITIVALLADDVVGALTNTATVTGTTPDPDPDNNSSTVTDQVTPESDLAIVKRTVTEDLVPGGEVEYELLVSNNGPSDSTPPITVTDELPPALTLVGATGEGWDCTGTTCTRDTVLEADEQAPPITITATIASDFFGELRNTASVTGPYPDPDPDNNTSTVVDPVPPLVDLTIAKEALGPFTVGQQGQYRITVGNDGPTDDPGPITVSDTLPTGLRFVSARGPAADCTAAGQVITCLLPDGLAAGASTAIAVVVDVLPAAVPSVTNAAVVSTPSPETDRTNNRDEVTVPVPVPPAPEIPSTGAAVARTAALGLLLLGAGALLLAAARRRRV